MKKALIGVSVALSLMFCMIPTSRGFAAEQTVSEAAYGMGETWTVDGQWSVTVDSVEETSERNPFESRNPGAVYLVNYTCTNKGYKDANGFMNGLFICMDTTIVDSAGLMGYSYPGDITYYAQEIPVGATCKAQVCVAVENPGPFKLYVEQYDGNQIDRTAVFAVTP